MNVITCNHKRCKKPAVVGFRPYENGYDVTSKYGKQLRCELHGSWLLKDGQPVRGAYLVRRKDETTGESPCKPIA